jgi:3'(2'), 5'-bisphosphate nucleotidase
MMAYEKELEVALQAADLARGVILDHYSRFIAIPDAKADISTQADRDSQETILKHLRLTFPADALVAEETTATLSGAPRSGPRLWIVDPIDGTRGFAKKNGEFSVMVALVDQGRLALGVVIEPANDRLTYATLGGGCWQKTGRAADHVRSRVRSTSNLASAILTQSHSRSPGRQATLVGALKPGKVLQTYSAGVKLAQVARGEADLYLNTYQGINDWDLCAGHILVEEAGGKVTGLKGETIRYGVDQAKERTGILASNGVLHDESMAIIRRFDV